MRLVISVYLAVVTAFIVSGCSREQKEYVDGQGQAERDLAKGEYKIAIADGSNMPAFWEYTELLRKRYSIGWCVYYSPHANRRAAEAWVRGYNEIASPRIEREVGAQILKQTFADAQKLHDATLPRIIKH